MGKLGFGSSFVVERWGWRGREDNQWDAEGRTSCFKLVGWFLVVDKGLGLVMSIIARNQQLGYKSCWFVML